MIYPPLSRLALRKPPFALGIGLGATGGAVVAQSNPLVVGGPTTGTISSGSTVTLPSFTAGQTLVVYLLTQATTPPATPNGWTYKGSFATPSGYGAVSVYTYGAAPGSATWVTSSTIGVGAYNAYALKGLTSGTDAIGGQSGTTGPMVAGVYCAGQKDLAIFAFAAATSSSPASVTNVSAALTSTAVVTNTPVALITGYIKRSAPGYAGNYSASPSLGAEWVTVSQSFK